jgi:hypothetical protein
MINIGSEDSMGNLFRRWGVLVLVAVLPVAAAGLALAQSAAPTPTSAGGSPSYPVAMPPGTSATPGAEEEISPQTELPVLYVTGVEIMRSEMQPTIDIVRVTGLTGSQGWSDPELVPTTVGKPVDGILDLQFIATMPLQSEEATGFVPVGAVFELEEGHAFKGVRVRASENAIEVDTIPGHKEVALKVNDCKDCVGKKFAERGQAAPGTPGVVRQEDLPKTLRWITPTHGIRGITHDPNRLDLLLSKDNTIIAAYWE